MFPVSRSVGNRTLTTSPYSANTSQIVSSVTPNETLPTKRILDGSLTASPNCFARAAGLAARGVAKSSVIGRPSISWPFICAMAFFAASEVVKCT